MLTEFVKVAEVGDIEDNSMVTVNVGTDEILLVQVNGEYFATEAWCNHAAGLLSSGELHADTCEVECPIHEGYFDLKTGAATNPPVEEPIGTYSVRVDGNDILIGPK